MIKKAIRFFKGGVKYILKKNKKVSEPQPIQLDTTAHRLSDYAQASLSALQETHSLNGASTLQQFKDASVLCLVEAGADVSYLDHIAPVAKRIDLILQGQHAAALDAVKRLKENGVTVSHTVDDTAFSVGSDEDKECATNALSFVEQLSTTLEKLFSGSAGTQFLTHYCRSIAQSIEPIIYYFCYFLPKLIDSVFSKHSHDDIVIFTNDGEYWGHQAHFISQMLDLERIHIIRTNAGDAQDRLVFAAKMSKIAKEAAAALATAPQTPTGSADMTCMTDWLAGLLNTYKGMLVSEVEPELKAWRKRAPYGIMTSIEAQAMRYVYSESRRSIIANLSQRAPMLMLSMGESVPAISAYKTDILQDQNADNEDIHFFNKARTSNQLAFDLVYFLGITSPAWLDTIDDTFLNRSVRGIFKSFGMEIFKDRLTDNIDMILFLEELFTTAAPSYVLTLTGEVTVGQLVLDAARARNIPNYDIQSVAIFDEPRCLSAMFPKSDLLFTLDRPSAELLEKSGWKKESLLVNGSPRSINLLEANHDQARRDGRKEMNLQSSDMKVVCFMTQALCFDEVEQTLEALAQLCASKPNTTLLVKVHPREPVEHDQIYKDIVEKFDCNGRSYVTREMSPLDATCASDVLVSLFSNTIFEAAMIGVPAVAVNLSGARYPEPMNLSDYGYAEGASSKDEVIEVVSGLLFEPNVRSKHLNEQKEFFAEHSYYTDGKALDRIVSTIYTQSLKP